MRFYGNFYADLPDEFVEAHNRVLSIWASEFGSDLTPRFTQNKIIDTVAVVCTSDPDRDDYARFEHAARSGLGITNWMNRKGSNYNGGYWKAFAQDQRGAAGAAGASGGIGAAAGLYPQLLAVTRQVAQLPLQQSLAQQATRPAVRNQLIARQNAAMQNALSGGFPMPSPWQFYYYSFDPARDEPKPPLKREIKVGEIVGYRCWIVHRLPPKFDQPEVLLLRSVYQNDIWKPGKILEGRELEDWDSRGIHAWKTAGSERFREYIRDYLHNAHHAINPRRKPEVLEQPAMVTGTVLLWGDIVEHEHGYRGEFAKVLSIDWLYPDETMMGREREVLTNLKRKYSA